MCWCFQQWTRVMMDILTGVDPLVEVVLCPHELVSLQCIKIVIFYLQ